MIASENTKHIDGHCLCSLMDHKRVHFELFNNIVLQKEMAVHLNTIPSASVCLGVVISH